MTKPLAGYEKEIAILHAEARLDAELIEKFKGKDLDAARICESIFERKLKLEAQLDVDLQDSWKSLKYLGLP